MDSYSFTATKDGCTAPVEIAAHSEVRAVAVLVAQGYTSIEVASSDTSLVATPEDAEHAHLQNQMRAGRKWNGGVNPQPKLAPFYRQFDKRKF